MSEPRLLLISRDDILGITSEKEVSKLFRRLARLTRSGYQLLATAPQPEEWTREHGGPDDALLGPESIRKRLADFGGTLEGVYYVPRSLLTQRRNREEALSDMMDRYSIDPSRCLLYSSSRKFVDAAKDLGIQASYLGDELNLVEELRKLLRDTDS